MALRLRRGASSSGRCTSANAPRWSRTLTRRGAATVSAGFIPTPHLQDIRPRCAVLRHGRGGAAKTSFGVAGLTRDIQVKIASERPEFEQAFELLATSYRARGYDAPSEKPFRFT